MLIGIVKGRTVHSFTINGLEYHVLRGRIFAAAWNRRTGMVGVLAPAGMSYHQAALEAAAGMERGEYK